MCFFSQKRAEIPYIRASRAPPHFNLWYRVVYRAAHEI